MKKVFIDTNILLDIALEREPFFADSALVITLAEKSKILAFTSGVSIANLYFMMKKELGHEKCIEFIEELIKFINVLGIDTDIVKSAINASFCDFEDGLQNTVAEKNEIKIIITRNKNDFRNSNLIIQTPEEFIKELQK